MPENEARAWWADVQHVRESIERRRGGVAQADASSEPARSGRFARATAAEPPVPRLDELDWPTELPSRGAQRFERSAATPARSDREPLASDDARVAQRGSAAAADADGGTRRHTAAVTETDRASARGRRPRAETDLPRTRSHRADTAPTTTARGMDVRANAMPAAEPHRGGADCTGRRASTLDMELERVTGAERVPARAPAARRTVQITGRPAAARSLPRLVEVERRRPGRRPAERVGPRPDRIALYAVLLGFFLILVAATSAHAAI